MGRDTGAPLTGWPLSHRFARMPLSSLGPYSRLLCSAAILVATQAALASGVDSHTFATVAPTEAGALSLPTIVTADHSDSHLVDSEVAVVPEPSVSDRATALVDHALALVGVRYRWGGNTPQTGLDCSGLVRYVFHEALGEDLPRRAIEISRLGERIGRNELKPGDLIFFRTLRRRVSHVGIYLGDGQFIHAPARGQLVRVESLDVPYWGTRYSGARRIEP